MAFSNIYILYIDPRTCKIYYLTEQVFRYSASAVPRLKVDRAHWVVVSPQGEPSLAEAGPQVSGV